ncbi:MAG: hypothetical protein ACTS6J_02105 [Burkholderiales bacterium]
MAAIVSTRIIALEAISPRQGTSPVIEPMAVAPVNGAAFQGGQTDYDTGVGFFLGRSGGAYKLSIGDPAGAKLTWTAAAGLVVVGTVTATAGAIGGWTINSAYLAKDTGVDATSAGMAPTDYPFYAGATYANRASAPFRITPAGVLTATGATISGAITATTGAIGGFTLGADYIRDAADSFGLASTVTVGSPTVDDVRFWAGDTFANRATAPLRMYESGAVYFGSGTFAGNITTSGYIFVSGNNPGAWDGYSIVASPTLNDQNAIFGIATGTGSGVIGTASGAGGSGYGVFGASYGSGAAVKAQAYGTGAGVYAASDGGAAGEFYGNVYYRAAVYISGGTGKYALELAGSGTALIPGLLTLGASTTARASVNVPHGAAPTSPANGDIWTTTAGMYIQVNGVTVGPLS